MPRIARMSGRLVLVLAALAAAVWFLVPREAVERGGAAVPDLADPAGWLAAREAAIGDIEPGTQARIVWAGAEGLPTETVVLYLHGFSATSEEIRPVPDRVAEAFGANLIFARLPGHGRDGAAMAEPRAGDWLDDVAQMLQLARGIGNRVVVIGTSTGGTLAAWAASDPEMSVDVAALVLVSPNFALANPAGGLLEWPLARIWVPWVAGAERRFEPVNEAHGSYWTTDYPTVATVTLGTLLRETRSRDFGAVSIPALFVFSDADQVVSAPATRAVAQAWGGPATLMPVALPAEGADPLHHVIAGDILSPAMTDRVAADIVAWLRGVLE